MVLVFVLLNLVFEKISVDVDTLRVKGNSCGISNDEKFGVDGSI